MRDWRPLVHERLNGRGLSPAQKDEIVAELAAHLEDLYEDAHNQGMSESDSVRRALDDVSDWGRLYRRIRHSKQEDTQMNFRTKSFWIPGFASLVAATGTLMIMNKMGIEPRIVWYGTKVGLQLYPLWLLVLPVYGALGAYLSKLANGQLNARLAAALFPVIALFVFFCVGIPASLVVDHHLPWRTYSLAFAQVTFNWVLLPAVFLLLGALPFLRNSQRREAGDFDQASC